MGGCTSHSYDKTLPSLGGFGGVVPSQKIIMFCVTKIGVNKEALHFVITLHLAILLLVSRILGGVGVDLRVSPY